MGKKKVAIYLRSSVKDSHEMQRQKELLMKKALEQYSQEGICFFDDDGYSALDDKRPAFLNMLGELKEGGYDAVYAIEMRRLTASASYASELAAELLKNGIQIFTYDKKEDRMREFGEVDAVVASLLDSIDIPDDEEMENLNR